MNLDRHDGPASFLAAAEPFLLAAEARHGLPLAVARTCLEEPDRYGGRNYFATVRGNGRVLGAALMTPPHQVAVHVPPAAAGLLAEDLAAGGFPVPGAFGPVECVDVFAAAWALPRGLAARRRRDLRAFSLERVIPAPPARGGMRAAVEGDVPTAAEFLAAFHAESRPQAVSEEPEAAARRAVAAGRLFLWQDGARVVAQARVMGFTATGVRVGAVYTPPGDRRRGYATALVGALSARLLAEGRRFCCLFTDLANPVANSIYPKVGYRPVGDFREWEWGGGGAP
ncbi:MAG: GNAT family N-acetyltransferase [Planctomycetes bacterium]|nr:GNAT family N-acetyltransferase [Planctomycetota bacterium]